MSQPFRVCVFGSSSKNTNPRYVTEGVKLGEELAKRGMLCVNGAGSTGVMGAVNKGCETNNGLIRGVIHEKFCVDFGEHPHIKDLIMVKGADLSERKQALLDHSDCILILPGGVGTFDEMWDCICGKSLGMKGMDHKPVCVVNIDGFYDGFIMQIRRAYRDGILYGAVETYFHVETDAIVALDWCQKVFHEGLAERSAASLMEHIKLNNIEDGGDSRIKERKTTVEVITEQTLKVEEFVWYSYLDYKNVCLAFVAGIVFGGMVQHLVVSIIF